MLLSSQQSTKCARIAFVLCTVALIGTPVASQAQTPKPFEAYSNSARSLRDSVVQMAKAQVGRRYRTGGTTPEKGFDCSGLVKYVMAALDLKLPRTARQQAVQGLAINRDTSILLPGDLLTFGKSKKGVSHVGIYIGEGKYIHASSVAGKVIESAIDRPFSPLIKAWKGARRMLSLDDSVTTVATTPGKGGSW